MVNIIKGYADTSIGQIHYRRAGEGPNLVMLHRTPTCSEAYEPVMQVLAPHLSVIAFDSPGFGMSVWLPRPFTIGDVARVIVEALDYLRIRKTSIFGHYTGASTGCEIAATRPGRVEKLILSGPVNHEASIRPKRLAATFSRTLLREDGGHLPQLWSSIASPRMLAPGGKPPSLEEKHRAFVWRLNAEPRVIEFPHAVYSYDMASRLPKIKAPTLVMAGEHDQYLPCVEPTARAIKGARTYVLPGGTGTIERHPPEELGRAILNFVLE